VTVLTLYKRNCRDVPGMLRQLAESIETGEHGEVFGVTCIVENEDGLQPFMWGDTDIVRAAGHLALTIASFTR